MGGNRQMVNNCGTSREKKNIGILGEMGDNKEVVNNGNTNRKVVCDIEMEQQKPLMPQK